MNAVLKIMLDKTLLASKVSENFAEVWVNDLSFFLRSTVYGAKFRQIYAFVTIMLHDSLRGRENDFGRTCIFCS